MEYRKKGGNHTMKYTKPEMAVLGDARSVIEENASSGKEGLPTDTSGELGYSDPAYDLDE
jgi:hypothetical protein